MKALILPLAFAIGLGAHAQSAEQGRKTAEEKAERRTERMASELQLTADQKAQVTEINLSYSRHMQELQSLQDEKARDNRETILKGNRDRSYQGVVTPEQLTKWNSLQAERKAKKDADGKDGQKNADHGDE